MRRIGWVPGMPRDDHFQDITVEGNVSLAATTKVEGDLDPDTDDNRDLGDATHRWRNLYLASTLNATGFRADSITLDIANADVVLSRDAANVLGLAAGDALALDEIRLDRANKDVILSRASANKLKLATGDSFQLDQISAVGNINNLLFVDGVLYTTAQAAHDALPAGGGTVYVPRGSTPFGAANTTTLSITKPIRLFFDNGAFTYAGTGQAIQVASGLSGVVIEAAAAAEVNDAVEGSSITVSNTAANGIDALNCPSIVIRNLSLVGPGSGTGKGIIVTGNGFVLDNTQTKSFGGDGTEIDGTRGNSNSGVVFRARSYNNGGRGFDTFGADSNAIVWIASDAQSNTGTQYVFTTTINQTFVGLHAQPSTDVNSISFVGSSGNHGTVYVEPISPFAAAAVSFDATSNYNNLVLLNGRVVSDSGTGNQWYFSAPDAGTGIQGVPQYKWNTPNVDDALNTVLRVARADTNELTKFGIYVKSASFRTGPTWTTPASLNFIYDSDNDGHAFNVFQNVAESAIDTATPVFSGDSNGRTNVRRLTATHGTALVAGDFALDANWGAGAAVSAVTGTDQACQFTVTAAGVPGASPVVTLTFKDGTWTNAPIAVVCRADETAPTTGFARVTTTATTAVIIFAGLPVAGNAYIFNLIVMGR